LFNSHMALWTIRVPKSRAAPEFFSWVGRWCGAVMEKPRIAPSQEPFGSSPGPL